MTTSMSSTELRGYRWFFLVAAAYDMLLGLAFFFLWQSVFDWIGMTLPPHVSYIQLPAVFVFIQGLGYAIVASDPLRNLGLVLIGIVYKGSYAALAAYYLLTDQIPAVFFAWFGLFDFLFLIGFVLFYRRARQGSMRT